MVDSVRWQPSEIYPNKRAALDRAMAWLADPDFAESAVEGFLDDLTVGAQRAYALGINAERSAVDELISTGRFHLLDGELREALLGYHRMVDFDRARLAARESTYAAKVYELTPRSLGSTADIRTDLSGPERERIARRALAANLEGPLVAEKNQAYLRQTTTERLWVESIRVLDLARRGGAF